MHRLAYTSRATAPDPESQCLVEILDSSNRNNRRQGLTGGLLISRGRFFQVLEGDRSAVEKAFQRIRTDPRHHDVRTVWSGPAAGRLFDGWAMAVARVSPGARVDIDRVIDEAGDYPHAAISSLHGLVQQQ